MSAGPKKHGLLDNVKARFLQQHEERQERVDQLQAKREAEIVHSRYLKQHVVDPTKMSEAKFAVDQWAKKHGTTVEKHIKQAVREKGTTPIQRQRKILLARSLHGGLNNHRTNYTSPQQDRLSRGSAFVSRTETGRHSATQTRRISTRDISESECIDVDSLDESMSLGNCIREFNKQAVVKKHKYESSTVVPAAIRNHNMKKRLSQWDTDSRGDRDTKQKINSNTKIIKEEILIEDEDDFSVISVDNPDDHMSPNPTSPDPVSLDPTSPDPVTQVSVTANLSGTMCCVVNCGADFSTKSGILEHEAKFDHSPCNPLLLTKDCLLPPTPLGYACPKCLQVFKTEEDCVQHQKDLTDHLLFLSPLDVACYLCPQCLALFPSHHHCQQHISQLNHHRIAYPFNGDTRAKTSNSPIPVSRLLAEDFLTRCRFVPFSVSCLDCTLVIESNSDMVQHLEETNHQHWHFIATATLQQVEAFSKYLARHSCSTCDSVMLGLTSDDDIHYCVSNENESVIGQIKDLNSETFRDFVRRCCISFMVSQDVQLTNKFTAQQTSSPLKPTTNRKRKRSNVSVCGKEIKVESSSSADILCDTTTERSKFSVKNEQDELASFGQNSSEDIKYHVKQLPMENSQILNEDCLDWSNMTDKSLIDPANLNKMKNIIFVNLDIWPYFFKKLPAQPSITYLCLGLPWRRGNMGGATQLSSV
ncbi:uncharacterized protein LOC117343210 [Pecten maximus]|uniref:uncharacterized protein LOC117343210 n=1 Tax=Pecten maximus TaxID=6579 RepID=UPI0014585728|nr:uncharacterized protein LOC117343210 [Pecten maximus]